MSQVRDPVCGMTVETERAPVQGCYAGEPVYFCSVACRRRYEASRTPDRTR